MEEVGLGQSCLLHDVNTLPSDITQSTSATVLYFVSGMKNFSPPQANTAVITKPRAAQLSTDRPMIGTRSCNIPTENANF